MVTLDITSGSGGAQNVSWTNVVGATANGNNLTDAVGNGWGISGASSTQTIGSGGGYVEFTATETTTSRMCGLSHSDPNQNYDLDFAIYPASGGALYYYDNHTLYYYGSYAGGDRFRVAVESGVVKYYQNGQLIHTSTVAPTFPLLVDTSLYSNGSTLTNVVISNGSGGGGSSAQIHWLVTDQLGTPRMIADQTGNLSGISRHDYLPFGEELFAGISGRTTQQGYTGDSVRQKFTRKERDIETGLDFFIARYYSSTQGRFTSPDPLLSSGRIESPQSWNRYSYVLNNPLAFTSLTEKLRDKYKEGSDEYNQINDALKAIGRNGDGNGIASSSRAICPFVNPLASYSPNGLVQTTSHHPRLPTPAAENQGTDYCQS